MTLILVAGLLAAQAAGLVWHLNERANLMAAGHVHAGMPQMDALPLRFIVHVALTLVALIVAALVAVRWATRPLQQLAQAANAFAHDLDAPPLPESGPEEVRQAAEAFNFMQQRLRGLVVERGRALAAVSHDLRTPLTRMRLRAELVEDPALQAKLDADIDSMQAMVDGVLSYLRGLEDTEPVQAINMEALLSSIVDDQHALGHRVTLVERSAGQPAPAALHGKLSVLRRAVINLVDNAVTYGQSAAVHIHDEPGVIQVVVDDDGPGIPPPDLQRVTEPFVRLDAARALASGGVGMGLAIVRDAAAFHGGSLRLENRPAGGLRAVLALPRR
ncbi:MAG: HAMP domain-containing protein [Burkholderiales bacterium]|nr:HAMP domain-containing protein [Burkholderiales bacterium]